MITPEMIFYVLWISLFGLIDWRRDKRESKMIARIAQLQEAQKRLENDVRRAAIEQARLNAEIILATHAVQDLVPALKTALKALNDNY